MENRLSAAEWRNLDRRREEVRNCWRIATDCGHPPEEAERVYDMVQLEMLEFFCPDFNRGLSIAGHARRWIKTGNPHHIDAAVHLCSLSGIAPTPTLAIEVAKVAALRMEGPVKRGTASKIIRAGILDHALTLMANLRATDASVSVETAASKAARYIAETAPHRFKASTLERRYSEMWLTAGRGDRALEDDLREAREDHSQEVRDQWRTLLDSLPEAEPSLKGWRR